MTVSWDINLLDGYRSTTLEHASLRAKAGWMFALTNWLRRQDIVVIHGHSSPQMLLAASACRVLKVPYLLRGESHAETSTTGTRRLARHLLAWFTVSGASGALPIGKRNTDFYNRYGSVPHFWAPYSVDNERFRAASEAIRPRRIERLSSLGLDPERPTVIFSGKLTPRKRPLDAVHAVVYSAEDINLLLLGDGPLRQQIGHFEGQFPVRCLGFVNQADLPGWYAVGDVVVLPSEMEPWGLVVNEGMACGLIPVVSDAVGCAPDLVDGIGEIYSVGNVDELAAALIRASRNIGARPDEIQRRLKRFSVTETARGYEQAALAVHR